MRPCIYCGLPKAKSQEHILASWIIEVLSRDTRGLKLPLRMVLSDQSGTKRVTVGKTKGKKTLEFTTRVCRDCNSGWMNDMETAARPYLEPMIRGQKCHIDAAGRQALTAWAAKFAVTARFAHINPDHIETQWTQSLFTNHMPPANWRVWAAHYVGGRPLWYSGHDMGSDLGQGVPVLFDHGVLATLVTGYCTLQVLGIDSVAPVGPEVDGIHSLWPPPGHGIDWPHPGRLDDSVIDDFATRWLGPTQFLV